ncbi:MAG: stage II sporulation protein P [Oscillospiraceae bacterium]|nr:stage II sporulation protein P [Oscillospiraceae bacterium]
MKRKIANAVLLTLCVLGLAVLTGALPVTAWPGPALPVYIETAGRESPPAETPFLPQAADREDLSAPEEAAPSPSPAPPSEQIPAPEVSPAEPHVRLIPTTITGPDLLDNNTAYDIDTRELLEEDLSLALPPEGYQVLILHTHTTEAYTTDGGGSDGAYRTTDPEFSVVRVGEELADVLTGYGLHVLHDTCLYDYPSYSGSYTRSGSAVEEHLAAWPGIRVVIDLHRDALGDEQNVYKTLADIEGEEAAQLMFVMGSDVNLEHPQWRENLKLALRLQSRIQERYPTLMRPTLLCDYRYNQQLAPGSLLLEVGTTGNTLEEALAAVRLFGEVAGPFLAGCIAE